MDYREWIHCSLYTTITLSATIFSLTKSTFLRVLNAVWCGAFYAYKGALLTYCSKKTPYRSERCLPPFPIHRTNWFTQVKRMPTFLLQWNYKYYAVIKMTNLSKIVLTQNAVISSNRRKFRQTTCAFQTQQIIYQPTQITSSPPKKLRTNYWPNTAYTVKGRLSPLSPA